MRHMTYGLVAAAFLWPLAIAAQAPAAIALAADTVAAQATAPVTIDGDELFPVRGVSALPAEQRARGIVERIEAFARDETLAPNAVKAVESADRTELVAGRHKLMTVVEPDALLEGVTRSVLAEVYRARIEQAVTSYRSERTRPALLRSSGYTLGAAFALAVALVTLRFAFRRLHTLLDRRFKARVRDLHIQSFRFLQAEQLWAGLQALLRLAYWLLVLSAVFVFLEFVLGLYPWTRAFARSLATMVLEPLAVMGRGVVAALPGVVFLVILFAITRYVLKIIRLFFNAVAQGTVKLATFEADWAWPTYRLVRLLVVALAVVVGYPYIPGSSSAAFQGISLFLGVIFSLGSTSIMANILAGYTMTYRRAFRVGDRVKIGVYVGDIMEVRLMVTRLRTLKNEEVVIPNSLILNGEVMNYSQAARDQSVLLHTTVGIGYETPWRQVEAMLLAAAERTPGLLREPPPFVLQQALGDFCITYELNAHCKEPQRMAQLYSALHQNILDVFNEYGVQIMTPAYEVDPAQPKVVPKDQWYAAPARGPAGTERG
jgi:small-conductance mechanosensitive channel